GIDLAPIDVTDPESCSWLATLIWTEHQERRERLRDALGVAKQNPPRIVSGDLLDELPRLAAEAPADATLVIFHSAVLAYLEPADRARFTDLVRRLPGRWISNEGHGVANQLPLPFQLARASGRFIPAVDGAPRALPDPHGQATTGLRVSGAGALRGPAGLGRRRRFPHRAGGHRARSRSQSATVRGRSPLGRRRVG